MHPAVVAATEPRGARDVAWLVGAGLLALLAVGGSSLLNDPDTQWHVAAGRLMWSTGAVPVTDGFSHTFAGAPWISKEPLSQLLLFAAYALGGWSGVALLAATAIAGSFALLFGWLARRLRWPAALALVGLALLLAAPEFLARPHILVLPVQVLFVATLAAARERRSAPPPLTPALMVLWVNMHASYPIGLALAAGFATEAVLEARRGERLSTSLRWGAVVLFSALAVLASPYGYRSVLIVLTVARTDEVMRYIQEWQPIGFDVQGGAAVAALLLAAGVLVRQPRANAVRIAMIGLLGFMMVRHARFALLFGLLAPIILAGPLRRGFPRLAPVPVRPRLAVPAAAALLLVALAAGAVAAPRPGPTVSAPAALAFARSHGLDGPVYNDYDYGGFLILNSVLSFIDGRNDQLFLGGFTDRLNAALAQANPDAFAAILDRTGVQWALVKRGSAEATRLSALTGWTPVFADGDALVFDGRPRLGLAPSRGGAGLVD